MKMQPYRPNLGPSGPARPRGPGIGQLVPNNANNAAQISQQQAQAAHQAAIIHQDHIKRREDAQKRSQKPVDRNLPDGIDEIAAREAVQHYKKMRDIEKKLDATMMRKRLDIQDSVHRDAKRYGTMRIWISNTVENQSWQYSGMDPNAYDFSSGVEATFRVKVEGRLLEPGEDGLPAEGDAKEQNGTSADGKDVEMGDDGERASKRAKLSPQPPVRKKFSHFFKSIAIDFDRPRELQPDGYTRIEWKRPEYQPSTMIDPPREADFDRLEFERKADENINVTISLVRDEQPERYRLSRPLAELLDLEEADRHTVLMGLWEYIRMAGLRTDEDQRNVLCDMRLREIFGAESLYFPNLRDLIRTQLSDPEPLKLSYTIRVDKAFHSSGEPTPTIYDIPVLLDDPLKAQMLAITRDPNHTTMLKEITQKDDELALQIQALNHAKAKHNFFISLSKDPANFIQRWMASQKRDLDVIVGAGNVGVEDWQGAEWRKSGVEGPWGTVEAREGVGSWLTRIK